MARHGENIRKRSDGRWEGRYKIYNEEKGVYMYRSVYGRCYEEVREKLTTQKNLLKNLPGEDLSIEHADTEHTDHETDNAGKMLFGDMAEEWLAQIKKQKKPSTYEKYGLIYRKYLEEVFRDAALSDMTDHFVREKLEGVLAGSKLSAEEISGNKPSGKELSDGKLSDNEMSGSLKKSIYCVVNQVLKYASVQYSIVLHEVRRPVSGVPNKPVTVFTKAELAKLFSVLYNKTDLFKMAILLCLYTGLRLGEICAMKWSDIDFANKTITVKRTVQRLYVEGRGTKTALVETEPKSVCSGREIPLPAAAMELFVRFRNDREYVFGGDKPMEPRTMQYHFKKILKEAKVSDKNFHILRHTFATSCIEGKMDVKSLSEILGHASVQITLNRYVHPSMETKREQMERLSRIYGQNCGQAS